MKSRAIHSLSEVENEAGNDDRGYAELAHVSDGDNSVKITDGVVDSDMVTKVCSFMNREHAYGTAMLTSDVHPAIINAFMGSKPLQPMRQTIF